ncbi:transcription repressor OFP12-like [Phragmites australis]|uniref:transcription repressor OFP12-like n=1 Tax=Phragmites australis TaxID=29695 RepID=UPI002D78E5B7|nr:transcription repressor OFP12-like [Phragmites australis]
MLGCFSRLRRPAGSPAPEPMPASDDASTSAASTSERYTSPCSSSSSARCKNASSSPPNGGRDDGCDGMVGKNPSALSEPGLSSAIASRRFFLSSPGRSNSIVDSAHGAAVGVGVGSAGVAVPTYSPDPHADFLRSMEEMAAALRLDARRPGDRARLHELLLCYLALNDRRAHKYVVSAFTDLLLRLTATNLDDEHHD